MAISGAVACLWISDLDDQGSVRGVLAGVAIASLLALVLGIWNGCW